MMPPTTLMKVIRIPATASPRTNLDAPSIDPKNELSSSSSLRRALACSSLIRPDDRSASMAICLPGIASRVKRAATSAIRPEPLVITTKLMMTRMAKTIIPITKLPEIRKLPNASITAPAACVPSCPCPRIRRVVAMFNASRNEVATRRIIGNELNSSGF